MALRPRITNLWCCRTAYKTSYTMTSQRPHPGSPAAPPGSQGAMLKSWSQIAGSGIHKTPFSSSSSAMNMSQTAASAISQGQNSNDDADSSARLPRTQRNTTSRQADPKTRQQKRRKGEEEEEEAEDKDAVYVLSLKMDKRHQEAVSALREKHFPPEKYKVEAHVTLFHAIPGSHIADVKRSLERKLRARPQPPVDGEKQRFQSHPFTLTIGGPKKAVFRLKRAGVSRGVGLNLMGLGPAAALRRELLEEWLDMGVPMTRQDRDVQQKLHYTIQNFAEKEEDVVACWEDVVSAVTKDRERTAGSALEDKAANTSRKGLTQGKVEGVVLWRYEDGRWVWVKDYDFFRMGNSKRPSRLKSLKL